MIDFRGKVALVTGGTRGIGRACALTLARHGCSLAIQFHVNEKEAAKVTKEVRNLGSSAKAYRADVSSQKDIRALVRSVLAEYGQIDVAINSAGISQVVSPNAITEEDWDRMMHINLRGTFQCCQEVLPHMMNRGSGSIVNLGSTAGSMGGFIVGVNYSVSKAGVICLTKSLARYAVTKGVRVNCVAPGLIDTDMVGAFPPERVEPLVSSIPMGRMGSAQEVANAVVFLASEAASYVTGSTVYINGGTYMG